MYSYELTKTRESLEALEEEFDAQHQFIADTFEKIFDRLEYLELQQDLMLKELRCNDDKSRR